MAGSSLAAQQEWRTGWPIVPLAALGLALSQIHIISLGFMIGPLTAEFGWSRSQITGSVLIFSLVAACLAPFAGRLIDRFPERTIGVPSVAGFCLCLAMLSQIGPGIASWWMLWLLLGTVTSLSSINFWITMVARRFTAQRGVALAVALCGTSIATMVMPTVTNLTLNLWGWRGTYMAFGAIGAALLIPAMIVLLNPAPPGAAKQKAQPGWGGATVGEALRSRYFPRLALAGMALAMIATSFSIHFVPMLLANGIPAATCAAAAGLIGVGAIAGRLGTGVLLDRGSGRVIGAFAFAAPILPCLLLLIAGRWEGVALASGLLLGLSSGAETDVTSYLATRYFGLEHYAKIAGILTAIWGVSAGVGPFLVSLIYDYTQSYQAVLVAIVPLALFASLAVLNLGPYPKLERP